MCRITDQHRDFQVDQESTPVHASPVALFLLARLTQSRLGDALSACSHSACLPHCRTADATARHTRSYLTG
jgi:hypothetical protein